MSPIISVIITAIIVAPITWVVAVAYRKNSYESKIGSAEEKSREIIDEALKIAETKMPDLNAASIESAYSMICGTARSMGITVVD